MKKGTHQDGMRNDYIIYRHVYIYIYTHILIGQVRLFFSFGLVYWIINTLTEESISDVSGFSHRRKVSRFPYGAEWWGNLRVFGFSMCVFEWGKWNPPTFPWVSKKFMRKIVFWSWKFWKTSRRFVFFTKFVRVQGPSTTWIIFLTWQCLKIMVPPCETTLKRFILVAQIILSHLFTHCIKNGNS